MSKKAPSNGDPSSVLIAAKLPARRDDGYRRRRRVLLDRSDGEPSQTAAQRDERCFGSEDRAERERGQCGQNDTRQLDRQGGTTGLETLGGRMTTISGEILDAQRDEHAGEGQ